MPIQEKRILLGHGSGGRLMHELIQNNFLEKLSNPILKELADSARLPYKDALAFTTDSFVVSPLFFPGGDIGKLSVCGTVNDLVMLGAQPEYLSLAVIIEEGLALKTLGKIVDSIAREGLKAKTAIVAGDLKVVERGACDKIFINTSGIGRIIAKQKLSVHNVRAGDTIVITGEIGQHGLAVLAKRKALDLGFNIKSDCANLSGLLLPILRKTNAVCFMRDPTRGGLATTLNEIVQGAHLGIVLREKDIPVSSKVEVACELLGIDPLYVANEGKAVLVVRRRQADKVVQALRRHPLGKRAAIIGEITRTPASRVILKTKLGTERLVDMLTSEPLPRIC